MTRFCTQCGVKNADDAKFCKACGTPLDAPVARPATAPNPALPPVAPHSAQPATRLARSGMSRRAGALIAGGMALLLLVVAAVAWLVLGRASGPSAAELKLAANTWLQQHQTELLQQDACVRNFDYAANPVFINGFDQNTQHWLNALVKAGIYTAPQQVRSGFSTQLKYGYGPQAARYIREGALCVADGLAVSDVQVLQPGSAELTRRLPVGVKIPDNWALVTLRLQWTGLAPWASQKLASSQFPNLSTPLRQNLLLLKTRQGWVLPSPSEELGMRAQLGILTAGGEIGQAVQQFGKQLGDAAQAFGAQGTAPAVQPPRPPGLFDWLKNLFSLGDPERELPRQFYSDVQNGRFDDAYALLGPQLQILGPDKMKAALAQVQVQIKAKGGVSSVTVNSVSDQGDAKLVRFTMQFGDGSRQNETMLVGKVNDQWRILSSSEMR